MNIELVTRDLQATDMLRERIETKMSKLEARLDEKLFVRVRLSTEAPNQYACSISFNAASHEYSASAQGSDLVRAADDTITKLERQVAKQTPRSRRSIRDAAL